MFLYPCCLKHQVYIVKSTNLKNRERERQRKREVRRQASQAQREKELERDRKNEGDIFVGETT